MPADGAPGWPPVLREPDVWRASSVFDVPARDRRVAYVRCVPALLRDIDVAVPAALATRCERAGLGLVRLTEHHLDAAVLPLLRSEATASSRIEQIEVSHRHVARALAALPAKRSARDVAANVQAMHAAVGVVEGHPLDPSFVDGLHRALLGHRDPDAGAVRTVQNWIGGSDHSPRDALYVPPAPEMVPGLLEDLVGFVNAGRYPAVVTAAVAHAQFESIHPYTDGNGRVGRALVHVVLRRAGLIRDAIPPVSLVLLSDRERYFAGLTAYRHGGVWEWVSEFVAAMESALDIAERLAGELAEVRRRWEDLDVVRATRSDATARRLVAGLAGQPAVDVATVATMYGVSKPAARGAIERLERAGVLRRVSAGRARPVWEAVEVFAVLDDIERTVIWKRS
jgi:Fic family protein